MCGFMVRPRNHVRMMKKLLNNPWAVAVLVLAAGLFAARNLVLPNTSVMVEEDDDTWEEIDGASAEQQLIGIEQLSFVNSEDIFWKEVPKRDPFSPHIRLKNALAAVVERQVIGKSADLVRRPRLSALIAGERSNFAVLDGQIVGRGDTISGYYVLGISSRGVVVTRDGSRWTINAEE